MLGEAFALIPAREGGSPLSTVSKSPASKSRNARRAQNLYRYGYRYVRVIRPDGTEDLDQVPLTEEDVLHPKAGDFIVQTAAQDEDRIYLKQVFGIQLEDKPEAVLSDQGVDWNIPGVRPLAPDIAVFFNVKRRDDWETFNVMAEGAIPALVVEVTSSSTRKNDLGIKVDYYHRAKVPRYLIADAIGRGAKRRVKLIGHQYARSGYRPISPGQHGRIYLEPVRLWIGITRDPVRGYERLACYDSETGAALGDYAAMVKDRNLARALAEDQSHARAEAEARAHAEHLRAEAEARARAEAEARIRQLEAALRAAAPTKTVRCLPTISLRGRLFDGSVLWIYLLITGTIFTRPILPMAPQTVAARAPGRVRRDRRADDEQQLQPDSSESTRG